MPGPQWGLLYALHVGWGQSQGEREGCLGGAPLPSMHMAGQSGVDFLCRF
jgi:hypothetical protein